MPDLVIRKLDTDTYDRFRRAAAIRRMTQAEYLALLLRLVDAAPPAILDDLGLAPVTG